VKWERMNHSLRNKKSKYVIVIFLILVAILIYPLAQWIREAGDAIHESTFAPIETGISLDVKYQGGSVTITPYKDEDGKMYFFLPSFTNRETTQLHYDAASKEDVENITYMHTSNLPALFLRSKTGTLDEIEDDKALHEGLLIEAIDENGVATKGMRPEYIKGHGNTSFQRDKKPYQIKFTGAVSFFGMSAKEKWILLANRLDPSYMRNYATYELARAIDLDAPEAKFVDLYINGEYRGNYLLTQKPENPSAEALLEHNYGSRLEWRENNFRTASGEGFVIRWPDIIPNNRMEMIRDTVQQTEDEIMAGDDAFHFDLEGFAKKYLIEEFVLNEAQSTTSAWYFIMNRKMYATSAWDYDKSYGSHTRFQEPTAITRQACYNEDERTEWYLHLTRNEAFQDFVWNDYKTKMLPALVTLVQDQIPKWKEEIRGSVLMDRLRWPANEDCKYDYPIAVAEQIGIASEEELYDLAVDQLTDWITKRCLFYNDNEERIRQSLLLRFLDSEGNLKKRDAVLPGAVYADAPDVKNADGEHVTAWKDTDTGETYPKGSRIKVTKDTMFKPVFE